MGSAGSALSEPVKPTEVERRAGRRGLGDLERMDSWDDLHVGCRDWLLLLCDRLGLDRFQLLWDGREFSVLGGLPRFVLSLLGVSGPRGVISVGSVDVLRGLLRRYGDGLRSRCFGSGDVWLC